jgi:plastocyanin
MESKMSETKFPGASLRRAGVSCVLALCASFVSSNSLAASATDAKAVDITQFKFSPQEITVAPGTTVRWINRDQTPHTVTSLDNSKVLNSKAMDTDDKFEFTFTSEGDYTYHCTVHPFMTGVVHVRKP